VEHAKDHDQAVEKGQAVHIVVAVQLDTEIVSSAGRNLSTPI
jgi:hypothetical protein